MNRVIEFRVWDKSKNKMYLPMGSMFLVWNKDSGTDLLINLQSADGKWDCSDNEDDCVIMQFTGLLDKNGKKIFEGDILKSDTDNMLLSWKVMFKDGCFGIRNIGIDGSENHAEFHAINSPYYFADRVIINNIYECPQIN
jgi:uncharacterized phage protein (TIGR01671 family)